MDSITPEEKLLRLIRGQKKTAPKTQALKTASGPKESPRESNKKNQKAQYRIFSLIRESLTAFYVKRTLWLILGLSVFYLIFSFVSPMLPLKKDRFSHIKPDKALSPETERLTESKPLESYLEAVRSRRIFGGATVAQSSEEKVAISPRASEAINNLNLVGIISGENPQAIIEDKTAHKTYYVSKGQFIGNFRVQDIEEGKVTLILEGQRFELYL